MTFTHIFDACAVLAYANKEVGWDVVAAILAKPTNVCRMHSVNWCEVWHIARKSNNETDVDTLISKLRAAGIGEESDIDAPFWREVGKCRHTMRAAGQQMALMDCYAVALANKHSIPVVTSDHGEFDYAKNNNVCRVVFIRDSKTQSLSPADFAAATN
jgi:PIN domain nuclease of toxin-antitoxin system